MTTFKKHYQILTGIEKTTQLEELTAQLEEIYFKGDIVKINIDIEIQCNLLQRLEEIDKYKK